VAKLNMSLNNKTKESIQNFEYINLYTYVHICIYRLVERICANRERERERDIIITQRRAFKILNTLIFTHMCIYVHIDR
jgi:hypothetical protein